LCFRKKIQQFQKDFHGYEEIIECLTSNFIGQNLQRQHLKINWYKIGGFFLGGGFGGFIKQIEYVTWISGGAKNKEELVKS
jgi:hypothetical protein